MSWTIWFQINDVLDEDNQDFDSNQSPDLDRSILLPLTRSKSDDMCYYLKPPSKLKLNVRVSTWWQILTKKVFRFLIRHLHIFQSFCFAIFAMFCNVLPILHFSSVHGAVFLYEFKLNMLDFMFRFMLS